MTDEKLEEKARQKARVYNTEYVEDCEFRDMISRPEDFIDGAIERMYLLLKEKHYRDGYIDGFKAREEKAEKENAELKELIEKYRQAVDKCLHITFIGGGREVNTIGQYATLVDGYLTDVEGLAKLKG